VKPTILIVDDEPGVRSSLSGVLRDEGYSVDAVPSGEDCLERVTRAAFDLIVLDVWLPGMDGLATLARLRERQVDAQIVLIVQQPALGRDFGIDLAPERDIRLQLGGTHERALGRDGSQRRERAGKDDYKKSEAAPKLVH